MFQRIGVALDGSLRAEQGVPVAARLARASGGSVLRWVVGSVTERLLNTTKLPMLIVRPPKEGWGAASEQSA